MPNTEQEELKEKRRLPRWIGHEYVEPMITGNRYPVETPRAPPMEPASLMNMGGGPKQSMYAGPMTNQRGMSRLLTDTAPLMSEGYTPHKPLIRSAEPPVRQSDWQFELGPQGRKSVLENQRAVAKLLRGQMEPTAIGMLPGMKVPD